MIEDPDDPTTVMLLKDSEWEALAGICKVWLATTERRPDLVNVDARNEIARRIVEACE